MNTRLALGLLLGMLAIGMILPSCGENACARYARERCKCCKTSAGKDRCNTKVDEYLKQVPRFPSEEQLADCSKRLGTFDCSKAGEANIYEYCGEE